MAGRGNRRRTRDVMNDNSAASAIQSWFSGNSAREKMEEDRVNNNLSAGSSGATCYQAESRLRRRQTVRMSQVQILLNTLIHFIELLIPC